MHLVLLLWACTNEPAAPSAAPSSTPSAVPSAPSAAKLDGDVYGKGVSLAESTPVSTLVARADEYDGKTVRVEGTVTDVCSKRGCWMNIASDQAGQELLFKVTDGEITLPLSARGRYAVAEGTLRKVSLSPEDAQAMRDEQVADGAAVDAAAPLPTWFVKLEGSGAVIRDRM